MLCEKCKSEVNLSVAGAKVEEVAQQIHRLKCDWKCPCHIVPVEMTEGCDCARDINKIAAILRPYLQVSQPLTEIGEEEIGTCNMNGDLHKKNCGCIDFVPMPSRQELRRENGELYGYRCKCGGFWKIYQNEHHAVNCTYRLSASQPNPEVMRDPLNGHASGLPHPKNENCLVWQCIPLEPSLRPDLVALMPSVPPNVQAAVIEGIQAGRAEAAAPVAPVSGNGTEPTSNSEFAETGKLFNAQPTPKAKEK